MDKGLKMLKEAARRMPSDPRVHYLLGSVYANHSGNAYAPPKALVELREAIRLDPAYALPQFRLARLYSGLHDWPRAHAHMRAYLDLMPPDAADKPFVKPILGWIDKH